MRRGVGQGQGPVAGFGALLAKQAAAESAGNA
jgi:hypothetical protein